MANNKIGCSVGKTSLVDPNSFDGQNSSNNVPVSLENLNISVELKTYKKGRTVLSASNGDGKADSTKTIKVSFLKGAEVNGKNVLTTSYTDLTTTFDSGGNSETLGITSIDIDFNSQQAPMVSINFIDLRGSAIFQNEDNISDGTNDYSTFFQLPYPLYELTVKGYYGKAVKYCLHMIKFTSKFNSKTGNFEITANFVGYTYAMLSDMLLGYLKAIPYTQQGRIGYNEINAERNAIGLDNILNLNELMFKISTINSLIEKVAGNDPDSEAIRIAEDKKEIIDQIKNQILSLGQSIDKGSKEKSDMYSYIIFDDNTNKQPFLDYVTGVRDLVNEFNKDNTLQLSDSQFTEPLEYIGLNTSEVNPNINATPLDDKVLALKLKMKVTEDFLDKKSDIYSDLQSKNFAGDGTFNLYDMSPIYAKLDEMISQIETSSINNKKNLAATLKTKIGDAIGFEPTIRNVVEVFTTAVEVYLGAIYNVSIAAEGNSLRTKQLESKFGNVKNSDLTSSVFFPWPDYREKEGTNGYTEKYLGEPGVLSVPSNVNELVFIEDLKKAFQKAEQSSQEAESALINSQTNWLPINPVDTRLFIQDSPYKRIEALDKEEVIRLMLIRGMTFLGYSNSESVLSDEAIIAMATNECETVITDVTNIYTKSAMSKITLSDFIDSSGDVNGVSQKVIDKIGDKYYYNYVLAGPKYDSKNMVLIPISKPYEGNWSPLTYDSLNGDGSINKGLKTRALTDVFLTNYGSSSEMLNSNGSSYIKSVKPDDGGIYLKMFTSSQYANDVMELRTTIDTTPKQIQKSGLASQSGDNSGISIFGGPYGIQDYSLLNYGSDKSLVDLPLMYLFYNKKLHQGLSRVNGKEYKYSLYDANDKIVKNIKLPYFGFNTNSVGTSNMVYDDTNSYSPLHNNLGLNRGLFNKVNKESTSITYPFVNYLKSYTDYDESSSYAFSLFGNAWYYEQEKSSYPQYAKALLYLNTLPWNTGNGSFGGTFESKEIQHLFNKSAGFIHAPRLWCAYVGGLLWRNDISKPIKDSTGDIIGGGSGSVDPIKWTQRPNLMTTPKRDEYLNILTYSGSSVNNNDYEKFHPLLLTMPEQAMNEFKQVFFDFVNGNGEFIYGWDDLKEKLEVSDSFDSFTASMKTIRTQIVVDDTGLNATLPTDALINNFKGVSLYYNTFTPHITESLLGGIDFKGLFLEFKGSYADNSAVRLIVDSMMEEIVIANTCYFVWNDGGQSPIHEGIYSSKNNFELYFNTIVKNFNDRGDSLSTSSISNEQEQAIFGTTNDSIIKFQLYRTCKNIYDKWVGGAKSADKIIFQCGDGKSTDRNDIDIELAKKNRGSSRPRLIDSYRFVNRSFRDIGDELFINPSPVGEFLRNNPNSSMYDAVGSLLTDNYFNFTPLPTYINYNDPEILESMFDTFSYSEAIENGTCGPTFVCTYIGQSSKHLDSSNSEYTNDGFDIQCQGNGFKKPLPDDFTSDAKDYENKVAVFAVNYSQQNQNIFKDITLDQSEFGETAESLQIVDDIANNLGSENNRSFAGQNIYNVYSVRSYKAEVEMMGNAMIQPMMYFQLNNIPMFHGAYMITHVKHSITPNNMLTNFSGVRIREPETKLFDAADLYMSIIDSLDTSSIGGNGARTGTGGGTFGNSGSNSEIKPFVDYELKASNITGLEYQKTTKDTYLIKEAGLFMEELAKRWYNKNHNLPNSDTLFINCFGSYKGGGAAKHSDNSRHYIGLAVDLRPMMNKKFTNYQHNVGQKDYDRGKNREFIQMVLDLSDEFSKRPLTKDSGPIAIQNIILNDTELINYFSNKKGSQGNIVISAPGHNNHIHMEWDTPSRVLTAIKDNVVSEDLVTSSVAGTIVKFSGKLPKNDTDKFESLGQI